MYATRPTLKCMHPWRLMCEMWLSDLPPFVPSLHMSTACTFVDNIGLQHGTAMMLNDLKAWDLHGGGAKPDSKSQRHLGVQQCMIAPLTSNKYLLP